METVSLPAAPVVSLALSPDGLRAAVSTWEGTDLDVSVYDLVRGGARTRLSNPQIDRYPVWSRLAWSPGGDQVAFTLHTGSSLDIVARQADRSGEGMVMAEIPGGWEWVSDWSRDGKYVVYNTTSPENRADLWYLERREDGSGWEPHSFLESPFGERKGRLSPSGHHIAYVSNVTGRSEIYVQPFPEGGSEVTISTHGGNAPRWSPDGKELFYLEGSTLVVVPVSAGSTFSPGPARRLFETSAFPWAGPSTMAATYDISPDGRRFLLAEEVEEELPPVRVRVVQNWFEEFRDQQED
jgi:Tol biopolymer transport system component